MERHGIAGIIKEYEDGLHGADALKLPGIDDVFAAEAKHKRGVGL